LHRRRARNRLLSYTRGIVGQHSHHCCRTYSLNVSGVTRPPGAIACNRVLVSYWCVFNPIKRVLLGHPLPSSAGQQERLSRITGLAVLSSDALSSVAYATDAMLQVLVAAGAIAV